MTIAILDARDKEYVVVAAGADLISSYVQQAILAGQTAQEVLDAILAAGLSEGVFPSLAAGESSTTDGQYFWVGESGTVTLYLNDSGSGDEIAELATAAGLALKANTADLAAPTGGEMVGTKQTGSNKKDRTNTQKANDTLSIADVEGVNLDGATDDSTGLVNAAADGRSLMFPNGVMKIDTDVVISASAFRLAGNGETSVIDLSGGGSLTIRSDLVALPNLSTDIQGGETVAAFSSAHGLSVGDVFMVWNPTDYSFASYRSYYRDGRMFRVMQVIDTTSVRFFGVSPRTFASGSVQCYKVDGGPVTLRDFRIIPKADTIPAILIDGHHTVEIDNVIVDQGSQHSGISIYRCYDVDVWFAKAMVLYDATDTGYPLVISNTQNFRIHGGSLSSVRHSIALGGGNDPGTAPVADGIIHDMMLQNRGDYQAAAGDVHGICEDVEYHNCIMQTVAGLGGRNITISGCTIYGVSPSATAAGFCVRGTEVVGGVYRLLNNRLITWGNGSSEGIVSLDVTNRTEDFELIARGNRIENRSGSTSIRAFSIALGSTAGSYRVDVTIDGLSVKGARPSQVLNLSGSADISALSRHIIQNLSGCDGSTLIGASQSANYTAPMRMPRTGGGVTLTATSGTNQTVSGNITLKYNYPRVPQPFVESTGAVNGNRMAYGSCFACTASTIRPMISANDTNWNATADRVVSWSVGIEDF